jgi:PAS domain S-box-containing protein
VRGNGLGVLHLDRHGEIQGGNREFFRQFGGSPAELCGRRFDDLVAPGLREFLAVWLTELLGGGRDHFTSRIVVPRRGRPPLVGTLTATAVRGGQPGRAAAVLFVRVAHGTAPAGGREDARMLHEVDARILEGIAAGLSSASLASRLFMSRQAVEYHVGRLMRRACVPNRVALVARAYSLGVLRIGDWPPRVGDDLIA